MKRIWKVSSIALAACLIIPAAYVRAGAEEGRAANCKAAYSCEFESGTTLYERNAEDRLPIASMCKIMTLLLSFEAVEAGELSLEEQIGVSDNAAGMGGSQVFLQSGLSYTADELMKTVAVCSANDSCVALAERIAGSEADFVSRMNARAGELGASNTLFANCTGLPKQPQYSCAKDVALMLRALARYDRYFDYAKIWLEDFAHPDGRTIRITNTNKLVRFYNGCDGGKTGFTNEAGFCLAATAKREEMRVVSVVIGGESSKARFGGVSELFDYAFANYEVERVIEEGAPLTDKLKVAGSKKREVALCSDKSICIVKKKGEKAQVEPEYRLPDCVRAPVGEGDVVGEAIVYRDGVECGRCNLVSMEDAARFSWWDALKEGAQNWN